MIVGQSDVDQRLVVFGRHFGQPLCRPTGHRHDGLPGLKVADGHVLPGDPHSQTRPKRFGTGLLGRPSFGIGSGDVLATFGLSLLDIGKDPISETVAKAFQRPFDPLDVAKVRANSKDHVGHLGVLERIWQPRAGISGDMIRALLFVLMLSSCGGLAWNTTVADHPQVRTAMLASVVPGSTTERSFAAQWGNPTQKIREGGQVSYVYRNMKNPPGYYTPQFGNSRDFVIVAFQYGVAIGAYSSDEQGCRATFAPRPPGHGFDNPATVHAVNCGVAYDGSSEYRPIAEGLQWLARQARGAGQQVQAHLPAPVQSVPSDSYTGTLK